MLFFHALIGEVEGLLLYGLRRPDEAPEAEIETVHGRKGTDWGEPWLLHGPGGAVDLWTLRLTRGPRCCATRSGRLVRVGYSAAWFAVEADFGPAVPLRHRLHGAGRVRRHDPVDRLRVPRSR